MIGDFNSRESQESDQFDVQKQHYEQIGAIIRQYEVLRDQTQWILMPSCADSGIMQVFPAFKLSDFFLDAFKGKS